MELYDLLPLLIPGILIQVLVQAYFIRHCWGRSDLTQRQKMVYILAIALLNLPAAAAYLFLTRSRLEDLRVSDSSQDIDWQLRQGIFVLLIIAFEIFALRTLILNVGQNDYTRLTMLLGLGFALFIINGLLAGDKFRFLPQTLPWVILLLLLPAHYLDQGFSSEYIVMIAVVSMINNLNLKRARIYVTGSFLLYTAVNIAKSSSFYGMEDPDAVIGHVYVNLLFLFLVCASFYFLKSQLLSNRRLQIALQTLQDQSRQLEAVSVLAERNRIAGEIHDTVGHTLTSALIAMEAGEELSGHNPAAAGEKFSIAKNQVRQSLQDVRSAVRSLHMGNEADFPAAVSRLLADLEKQSSLVVHKVIEMQSDLLPIQQHVLLLAIKECATNSLRHGRSQEADLLVQEYRGQIQMSFSDNGRGTDQVVYGFGLETMAGRVRSLGGSLTVESQPGEGFTVQITLPTGVEQKEKQDEYPGTADR